MVLGRAQVVFSYDSTYLRIAVVRLHPLALVSNQNKLKELKNASLISINRLLTSFSKHHKIYLEINIFVQCNTACWSVSGVESRAHIYITQAWSNDWAFCMMLSVMYMKNKIKIMVLSGLLIGGTVIMMWLKENIGYILCWCIVIAMLSFMWLP